MWFISHSNIKLYKKKLKLCQRCKNQKGKAEFELDNAPSSFCKRGEECTDQSCKFSEDKHINRTECKFQGNCNRFNCSFKHNEERKAFLGESTLTLLGPGGGRIFPPRCVFFITNNFTYGRWLVYISKFKYVHPGHFAIFFRSIGCLVKIWWVIPRIASPNLELRIDQNLECSKIGPSVPLFRGPPHPEF